MLFGHGGRVVQAFFAVAGGLVSINVLRIRLRHVLNLVKTRGTYTFMLLGKALSAHFLRFFVGVEVAPQAWREATEGGLQRRSQSLVSDIPPRAARLPTKWAVGRRRNRAWGAI